MYPIKYLMVVVMVMAMLSLFVLYIHPMNMMVTLVIYSATMSSYLSYSNPSQYLPYMLFLIMVGGMLIVFSYLVSLTNFDPVPPINSKQWMMLITSMLMIMSMMLLAPMEVSTSWMSSAVEFDQLYKTYLNMPNNMFPMFTSNLLTTLLCVLYLLMTLLSVMKICLKTKSPMRQRSLIHEDL